MGGTKISNIIQNPKNVSEFLEYVDTYNMSLKLVRSHYDQQLAPKFSLFDFIDRDELKLSKILAWLLNPKASHAQGYRFLLAYAQRLGLKDWSSEVCANAAVIPEQLTNNRRRLDIYIRSGDNHIGIENKPYAGDQDNQIKDYLDWLKTHSNPTSIKIIYLSATGEEPSETSISAQECAKAKADGHLHTIGYQDLVPWLEDCLNSCQAERVTGFIKEFKAFIETDFLGKTTMSSTQHITDLVMKKPELLSAAMSVAEAHEQYLTLLYQKLETDTRKSIPEAKVTRRKASIGEPYCGIQISFSPKALYSFTISADFRWCNGMHYGLRSNDKTPDFNEHNKTAVQQLGTGYKSAPHFCWYNYMNLDDRHLPYERNWQFNSAPWESIADGTMARKLADVARLFRKEINDHDFL